MLYSKLKHVFSLIILNLVAGVALASTPDEQFGNRNPAPELPPQCSTLQVPAGNKVAFRTYALGVQIYRWNGTSWDFVEPVALLFADSNFRGKVGIHYAGPTWESNSGSNVVGRRLAGCSADSTAIDWLLLEAVSTEGPGIFKPVTYIHRVNTVAGRAPASPGLFTGAVAKVPYLAEYYFYRAHRAND
jgi:hypothetical protein